jgi:hypothetical protein
MCLEHPPEGDCDQIITGRFVRNEKERSDLSAESPGTSSNFYAAVMVMISGGTVSR